MLAFLFSLILLVQPGPAEAGAGGAGNAAAAAVAVHSGQEDTEIGRQLHRLAILCAGDSRRKVFHDELAGLYAENGYRPLWTDPAMVRQLLEAVESADDDGLDPADYHLDEIRAYLDAPVHTPARQARYDLLMSDALLTLGYHLHYGKVNPEGLDPDWNLSNRAGRAAVGFRLHQALSSGKVGAELGALRLGYGKYVDLRRALGRYRAMAAAGGWPVIPSGKAIRVGVADPRVPLIRRRLEMVGDLQPEPSDTSTVLSPILSGAIRSFQKRHALEVDGLPGAETIAAMNVPASRRVEQIRVNLERYRWFVGALEPTYVLVNIAGFSLHYIEDGQYRWGTRVIVGRPYRKTPVFKSDMTSVVFNPSWVIPPTILRKDALPAIRAGKNYLEKFDVQVIDASGRVVDPSRVDWSVPNPPYTFRQSPGDHGALGRVKFMMANRHLVYLHDTPGKQLFERRKRTFSSGCIRVEDPQHLAFLVLRDSLKWSQARIGEVIAAGKTLSVPLPRRIPVFILYLTTVAEGDAVLFREDVYDRDRAVLQALLRPLPDYRMEYMGF